MTEPFGRFERVELTEEARPKVRPRGIPTGHIVGDGGECWHIIFDGTKTTRAIFKPYVRRASAETTT